MPIYGFECDACGHRFDRLQKLSDPDPTNCPECKAQALRRQLTAPAFRLSGSGWYETDFKKDGDVKRNLVDKAESSAGESKPESKSDAKSDAKPVAEAKPAAAEAKPGATAPVKTAAKADPASNGKAGQPIAGPAAE